MIEHLDVVVVGAGISGISAGYHLQDQCPERSFAMLEARDSLGGTWDLFRFPGIRCDSDMSTLGFSFHPWDRDESIAEAGPIKDYLVETTEKFGLDDKIRYRHRVERAEWSSDTATWTLTVGADGTTTTMTCSFLFVCAGYYSYREGYSPEFPGRERFAGPVVHPQQWPDDLDHSDQRVVVIGSGATAFTLVPSLAKSAERVTMLQRSPSYVISRPSVDPIGKLLGKVLPERWAVRLTAAKNTLLGHKFYRKTRTDPDGAREMLLKMVSKQVGQEITDAHFTPSYNPWDQRVCVVPDGDLFDAINSGKADVVTDHIESFTETGIALKSGEHLDADIIVTATGLNLVTLGEIEVVVDGDTVDFADTWTYKGLGYSDVPNLMTTFGFINASWTLRADMVSDYVCRLLNHLDATGTDIAAPRLRPADAGMTERPFIDDFSSGYMQRSMHLLPKQGDREPWVNTQDIYRDRKLISEADIDDGVMHFEKAKALAPA